jgi:hypothetical protein
MYLNHLPTGPVFNVQMQKTLNQRNKVLVPIKPGALKGKKYSQGI